jgi:hypothetical protein
MSRLHLEPAEVAGESCVRVAGAPLEPVILCAAGPRIVGLEREGSNLFAVCPDAVLESPGIEPLRLHGGHRLWVAPEVPEVTYRSDVGQVEVSVDGLTVSIRGATDDVTGLQREIRMRLSATREMIEVDHVIANRGRATRRLAPWALTMLPVGGEAVLPQATVAPGAGTLRPHRSLVLWPYTRLDDDRLDLGDDTIIVRATPPTSGGRLGGAAGAGMANPLKLGWPNARGWIAYRNRGTVFVKSAKDRPGASYPDYGASAQCYVNESWLELETLGPFVNLRPGTATRHREHWLVADARDGESPADMAGRLGLD